MSLPRDVNRISWEEVFYYDETSPSCLRWNTNIYSGKRGDVLMVSKGDAAGNFHKGIHYWVVRYDNKKWLAHRIIWRLQDSLSQQDVVDHVDGDKRNNKISNLRKVSHSVNCRNHKQRVDNKTGVTGVYFKEEDNKFVAAWQEDMKSRSRSFKVNKFGHDEAFRLACEHRTKMIEQLNSTGAGYTERHGT